MTFFYKFWKKARVYYTLSISRGGGPRRPPWIRHCNSNCSSDIHETQDLVTFWLAMRNNYPQLAYIVLLPISSTYLCASAFCTLVSIKSKSRNKLSNVEADLRCALTNTIKPRIKQLVASKEKQISH